MDEPESGMMNRHSEMVCAGAASIETYVDGDGPAETAPILEIIAALDPFHPQEQWCGLRDQFGSRATSMVIEDASHALFPEQPAAVVSYLDNLI